MLQNKSLATITDLDKELCPFTEAFSVLIVLIENEIIIPVFSTLCSAHYQK